MSLFSDIGAFVSSPKFGDTVQGISNTVGGVTDTLKSVGVIKTTQTGSQKAEQVKNSINSALNDFSASYVGNKIQQYIVPIGLTLAVVGVVYFAGKKRG